MATVWFSVDKKKKKINNNIFFYTNQIKQTKEKHFKLKDNFPTIFHETDASLYMNPILQIPK